MLECRSPRAPSVWAIVTCKGRRRHLERSLPRLLADPRMGCCLVDYDCPDGSAAWFSKQAQKVPDRTRSVWVKSAPYFHKAQAQNLGAHSAIRAGARTLLFIDADTLCTPGLGAWLEDHLLANQFCIASLDPHARDVPDLLGVIALPASWFVKVGGYDERFRGWGAEDVELRLRLHVVHGLCYREIPRGWLDAIEHDDSLRCAHYAQKSIDRSNLFNQIYMLRKIEALTGLDITRGSASVRRLLFQRGERVLQLTEPRVTDP